MDDPNALFKELLRQAEEIAHKPQEEQERWLADVRKYLADLPDVDRKIEAFRDYMKGTRLQREGELLKAHHGEFLEAILDRRIGGLLSGKETLSKKESERTREIALIAVLGHLLPHVKKRLEERDAQDFLMKLLDSLLPDSER